MPRKALRMRLLAMALNTVAEHLILKTLIFSSLRVTNDFPSLE